MPTTETPGLSLSPRTGCTFVLHLCPTCTIDCPAARPDTPSIDNTKASGRALSTLPVLGPQGSLGAQLMSATLETKRPLHDSILQTTTTWGARFAFLALITLLAAALSFADGKHKLSKDLEELKSGLSGATVDVIIQFKQAPRSEEHTSELQSLTNLVCRLLLEKK